MTDINPNDGAQSSDEALPINPATGRFQAPLIPVGSGGQNPSVTRSRGQAAGLTVVGEEDEQPINPATGHVEPPIVPGGTDGPTVRNGHEELA